MERLGHKFEQIKIGDEARAHLGDNYYHAAPERAETPPAPFSNVPFPRDPDYVRRGAQSDEIEKKLATPGARVALVGLGGIGKSQLAIEYAHTRREEFPDSWVLWMHASSAVRFDQSVRDIVDQLKISGRHGSNANLHGLLRSWLRDARKGRWLVILDNADEAEYLLEPLSTSDQPNPSTERRLDYLPICDHGAVLFTTRRRDMALKLVHRNSIVDVHPMAEEHAVELMQKKLTDCSNTEGLVQLASDLDFMPLAMAQAAAYIDQRGPRCSVQQYTEKLRKSKKSKLSLLNREEPDLRRDREANNSIVATWQISFEHISKIRPSAADVLSLMSFFDRQGIPQALLSRKMFNDGHGGHANLESNDSDCLGSDSGSDPESSADKLEDDIQMLRDYSFISDTTDVQIFEMHALVQLATQKWLDANGRHYDWQCAFIMILETEIPWVGGGVEDWPKSKTVFPHAMAALQLDVIGSRVELEFANLLLKSGEYAFGIGDFLNAERFFKTALKILNEVRGCENVLTFEAMSNLASTYWKQGRLEEAEQLEWRVLKTGVSTLGKDHPVVLQVMSNLATTYWHQGRLEEAERLELQVLESRKSRLGNDHPDTLRCIGNLATTYKGQDRLEEAEQLLLQAVQSQKAILGEEHPNTLASMHNLASTYFDLDRVQEAHELEVHVLSTRARVLGQTHPVTLDTMSNLSFDLRKLGRRQSAVDLISQCAAMSAVALGSSHPDAVNRDRWARRWELELVSGDEEEKIGDSGLGRGTL